MIALESLIDDLSEHGYAVVPHALGDKAERALQDFAHTAFAQNLFRAASVGIDSGKHLDPGVRGDLSYWVDDWTAHPALETFHKFVQALQLSLRRELYLSAKSFEGHFALYPPGAGYQAHLDQHASSRHRQVSVVLYLSDLEEGDGGELVLHNTLLLKNAKVSIRPKRGTMVVFLSDKIVHEVCATRRERWSLTGWIRDDERN